MATKPSPPVKKLVVLEEATLIGLANQQTFLKEFPFLNLLKSLASATTRGSCNTCGANRARSQQRASTVLTAKQTIAGMGDDQKRKLKRLLNTEKVRVTFKQGAKIVQQTF